MGKDAIHPGAHLADQLTEHGLSATALGRQINAPTNRITGILNGQHAVTGDSAQRLAKAKAGATIRRLPRLGEREKSEPRRSQARTD